MRIYFENNGQDILWWDVDINGAVTNCGPSLMRVHVGKEIGNFKELVPGAYPIINGKNAPIQFAHQITAIKY